MVFRRPADPSRTAVWFFLSCLGLGVAFLLLNPSQRISSLSSTRPAMDGYAGKGTGQARSIALNFRRNQTVDELPRLQGDQQRSHDAALSAVSVSVLKNLSETIAKAEEDSAEHASTNVIATKVLYAIKEAMESSLPPRVSPAPGEEEGEGGGGEREEHLLAMRLVDRMLVGMHKAHPLPKAGSRQASHYDHLMKELHRSTEFWQHSALPRTWPQDTDKETAGWPLRKPGRPFWPRLAPPNRLTLDQCSNVMHGTKEQQLEAATPDPPDEGAVGGALPLITSGVDVPVTSRPPAWYGWSKQQQRLWTMVANGVRVDVGPFTASNVKNKWWGPAIQGERPIMYHTHLHKCAGTLICKMARSAFHGRANRNYNCNIPKPFWGCKGPPDPYEQVSGEWDPDRPYGGQNRTQMHEVYNKIKRKRYAMVAIEGSLEDQPIFHGGPYKYTIVLRDPLPWLLSMYMFERVEAGDEGKSWTLEHYLHRGSSGKKQAFGLWHYRPNFFTRRLCGWSCVHVNELQDAHFIRALTFLEQYDIVMVMSHMVQGVQLLTHHYPDFVLFADGQLPPRTNSAADRGGEVLTVKGDLEPHPKLLARANELTFMDQLLFERAMELFQHQYSAANLTYTPRPPAPPGTSGARRANARKRARERDAPELKGGPGVRDLPEMARAAGRPGPFAAAAHALRENGMDPENRRGTVQRVRPFSRKESKTSWKSVRW